MTDDIGTFLGIDGAELPELIEGRRPVMLPQFALSDEQAATLLDLLSIQ